MNLRFLSKSIVMHNCYKSDRLGEGNLAKYRKQQKYTAMYVIDSMMVMNSQRCLFLCKSAMAKQ